MSFNSFSAIATWLQLRARRMVSTCHRCSKPSYSAIHQKADHTLSVLVHAPIMSPVSEAARSGPSNSVPTLGNGLHFQHRVCLIAASQHELTNLPCTGCLCHLRCFIPTTLHIQSCETARSTCLDNADSNSVTSHPWPGPWH